MGRVDAWAVVTNEKQNRVFVTRESNFDPRAGLAVLNRIFDQVIEDLAHFYRVQQDQQWFTLLDKAETHLLSVGQGPAHR